MNTEGLVWFTETMNACTCLVSLTWTMNACTQNVLFGSVLSVICPAVVASVQQDDAGSLSSMTRKPSSCTSSRFSV